MARFFPSQGVLSPKLAGSRREYLQIRMQQDGVEARPYVHRLVCEAFHGPCPKGYECDHKDEDTRNNRADNLRWIPRVQNMRRQDRNFNYDKEGMPRD